MSEMEQTSDSMSIESSDNYGPFLGSEPTKTSWNRPIVVGYAFGPKKMSTMGVVMAEASKTHLTTTSAAAEEDVSNFMPSIYAKESNHFLTQEALSSHMLAATSTDSTNATESQARKAAQSTKVVFSVDRYGTLSDTASEEGVISIGRGAGGGSTGTPRVGMGVGSIRQIVRNLRSSGSSNGSTGTRTASTAASFRTHSTQGTSGTTTTASIQAVGETNNKRIGNSSQPPLPSHAYRVRVSFVPLDPEIPLEEQHGGIDIILHKLTEDILCLSQLASTHPVLKNILQTSEEEASELFQCHGASLSDTEISAVRRVHRLCQFQRKRGCTLVDDPVCVQTLLSRADIAHRLQSALQGVTSQSGIPVSTPPFAVIPERRSIGEPGSLHDDVDYAASGDIKHAVNHAELSFPLIVKPLAAAGTKASHSMAIVTNPSGLEQIVDRLPCLCQEYVNHDAILYKVYVLGDFCSVHKRRSLPNLPKLVTGDGCGDEKTPFFSASAVVEFDSQRPYPRLSDFGYQEEFVDGFSSNEPSNSRKHGLGTKVAAGAVPSAVSVSAEEVRPIVKALKEAFGLELFGFDVLIGTEPTRRMLVVDVNYFPSYKEVPNFPALLAKFLTERAISGRLEKNSSKQLKNMFG